MKSKDQDRERIADIYIQFIEIIGLENTKKIYEVFRGQQIVFPKRFYKQEFVIKDVVARYDGTNINELAREYDYTDRYLRRLMSEYKKELDTS